jgi:hypothetical protein
MAQLAGFNVLTSLGCALLAFGLGRGARHEGHSAGYCWMFLASFLTFALNYLFRAGSYFGWVEPILASIPASFSLALILAAALQLSSQLRGWPNWGESIFWPLLAGVCVGGLELILFLIGWGGWLRPEVPAVIVVVLDCASLLLVVFALWRCRRDRWMWGLVLAGVIVYVIAQAVGIPAYVRRMAGVGERHPWLEYEARFGHAAMALALLGRFSLILAIHQARNEFRARREERIASQVGALEGPVNDIKEALEVVDRREGDEGRERLAKMEELVQVLAEQVKSLTALVTPVATVKKRREPGDAKVLLIAALSAHHHYGEDEMNFEPIRNNQLARKAGVGQSSASDFFTKHFKGYEQYQRLCKDHPLELGRILRKLNDEQSDPRERPLKHDPQSDED